MKSTLNRNLNGNIELKFSIPWPDIKKAYEKEVDSAVAEAEVTGFRKGKAPRELVEPKLNRDQLYSQAIQSQLPEIYAAALKEHNLRPILHPKLTLTKGEEGSDWEFLAVTCEAPTIALPDNYSDRISKLKVADPEKKLEVILDYLSQNSKVSVSDLLVEEEANHRLSHLVENITKLGLTTESYLASKKITPEDLKSQTATAARTDLGMEFILNQIASDRKLKDRKATLDFLTSLV